MAASLDSSTSTSPASTTSSPTPSSTPGATRSRASAPRSCFLARRPSPPAAASARRARSTNPPPEVHPPRRTSRPARRGDPPAGRRRRGAARARPAGGARGGRRRRRRAAAGRVGDGARPRLAPRRRRPHVHLDTVWAETAAAPRAGCGSSSSLPAPARGGDALLPGACMQQLELPPRPTRARPCIRVCNGRAGRWAPRQRRCRAPTSGCTASPWGRWRLTMRRAAAARRRSSSSAAAAPARAARRAASSRASRRQSAPS